MHRHEGVVGLDGRRLHAPHQVAVLNGAAHLGHQLRPLRGVPEVLKHQNTQLQARNRNRNRMN